MAFPNDIGNDNTIEAGGIASLNELGPSPPGPFSFDGTTRYYPLYDTVNFAVDMWKSVDTGTTWTKVDTASHPTTPGTQSNNRYNYYNACVETASSLVHVVYWNTSSNIALISFDMAASTWGSANNSSLAYNTFGQGQNPHAFTISFRALDRAVWMGFLYGPGTAGGATNKFVGAKAIVGGAWDASVTTLGGTASDGLYVSPMGMGTDTSDIVHYYFTQQYVGEGGTYAVTTVYNGATATFESVTILAGGTGYRDDPFIFTYNFAPPPGPDASIVFITATPSGHSITSVTWDTTNTEVLNASTAGTGTSTHPFGGAFGNTILYHRTIQTDDTLTSTQAISTNSAIGTGTTQTLYIAAMSMPTCTTSNTLGFTIRENLLTSTFTNISFHAIRGSAASTPTWDITTISAINAAVAPQEFSDSYGLINIGGLDTIVYGYYLTTAFDVVEFDYVTSTGIGGAWSNGTLIGTVTSPNSGIASFIRFNTPGSLGFAFPFSTDSNQGLAYWELTGTAPPAVSRFYFIPQYIKRHNAPGH